MLYDACVRPITVVGKEVPMKQKKAKQLDAATKRALGMEAVALRHCKHKVVPCAKKVAAKTACRKWKGE